MPLLFLKFYSISSSDIVMLSPVLSVILMCEAPLISHVTKPLIKRLSIHFWILFFCISLYSAIVCAPLIVMWFPFRLLCLKTILGFVCGAFAPYVVFLILFSCFISFPVCFDSGMLPVSALLGCFIIRIRKRIKGKISDFRKKILLFKIIFRPFIL